MRKKLISLLFFLAIFMTSCVSWDSVKKGIVGGKKRSTDEFLVKKKDPLVMPPHFNDMPKPGADEVEDDLKSNEIENLLSNTKENLEEENDLNENSSIESIISKKLKKK